MSFISFKFEKPVIVIRSNDICFLGILRSLASAGIPAIPVIFQFKTKKTWYSQYSKAYYNPQIITNPYDNAEESAKDLVRLGKETLKKFGAKLLILPSSDTSLILLLKYQTELSKYFSFMGHYDFSGLNKNTIFKSLTYETLRKSHISVPESISIKNYQDTDKLNSFSKFPCVVKPSIKDYSNSFYARHNGSKAVDFTSRQGLTTFVKDELTFGTELIVQEKIRFDGPADEVPFYVYVDKYGDIKVHAVAIKEYLHPHPFGTALVLSISQKESLINLVKQIITAIQWRGFLMIEFIWDKENQEFTVIELNGRPWLLIDYFRRVGLPYIEALYMDYENLPLSERSLFYNESSINRVLILEELFQSYNNAGDFIAYLEKNKGLISSYYLDGDDPEPGLKEFESVTKKLSKNNFDLGEYFA